MKKTWQSSRPRKKLSFSNRRLAGTLLILLTLILVIALVHLGSRPKTYNLHVSDASPFDIETPRSIVNWAETNKRAAEAMAQVPNKLSQSEEISTASLTACRSFLELVKSQRNELYIARLSEDEKKAGKVYQPSRSEQTEAATRLLSSLKQNLKMDFDEAEIQTLLEMASPRFDVFENNLLAIADVVMRSPVDNVSLFSSIREESGKIYESELYYQNDRSLAVSMLGNLLRPNMVFNREATENARRDAYNRVQQNPILINRGTRIVSEGAIITNEIYDILKEVDLIDSEGINGQILAGQALLILLLGILIVTYLWHYHRDLLGPSRESFALILTLLLPLLVAAYLGQRYHLSPPVYFTAVVVSAYFGFETSLLVSSCLVVAVMPIVNFNPAFLLVGISGSAVAALFTQGISNQDNFAKLILSTALSNLLSSAAYTLMQGSSWASLGVAVSSSVISGVASVIAAIGFMPLFELVFNTVSPIRLIELSQPGHPLMRRLFLEAPGTSQHSMMVANLADAAAEAVGANAMICRVGAYYHDIGKLENPIMFTENQLDYNPHDFLSPEASAEIITRHPADGVKLGLKSRLPGPVLRIIREHHGTTVLQYFYMKARELAEREGSPAPKADAYRYPGPLPSSRESAIVMLADSTEAAVKSSQAATLEEAEKMMRQVFKIKNEQNQLNRSGLSYADVDEILEAFLQVYAGNFHERVKYPDEPNENHHSQQAEKV